MRATTLRLALFLTLVAPLNSALAITGATVLWTTYEAETMTINGGQVLGPPPIAADRNLIITNTVEAESSGRLCVKLAGTGQYVQFAAQAAANTLVVRYCVPDTADGIGADYTVSLYLNGIIVQKIPVTSKYSWLYGEYTFSNNPGDGKARNVYDEARLSGLSINPGDLVRLQVDADDTAAYYIFDLVDLENIDPALTAPPGSRSVLTYGAVGNGIADDTVAVRNSLVGGGVVFFPPGKYLVTGDINVPPSTTIQGAGMWYTTFVGSPTTYVSERGRVRFNGMGANTHFADFAIVGRCRDRNDSFANDGFSEVFSNNSTMARIWVEHTKTGAWIANAIGMLITDCRFRNTIADGINLSVGCNSCIVSNCTARNTGDDSFAIWPATYYPQSYEPGYNVITHCTAQSPWFANTLGIYGGVSNKVENCLFRDVPNGAGILIAGTFPIGPNIFTGITIARDCDIIRAGGNDPGWQWRGALTICPQNINIAGLEISNINISNSLSYAVQFVSPGNGIVSGASMSNIKASGYGVGVALFHPQDTPGTNVYVDGVFGVLARNDAKGSINVSDLSVNGTPIISLQTPGTLITNQSGGQFTFNLLTQPISVTVQANPPGHTITVDSVTYTNSQVFNWTQGSLHTIAAPSPQSGGPGVQDVWTSWSDGGAISHTITPLSSTTYTANFIRQFFLTMNAGAGGSVSPASGWQNNNAVVNISATPSLGFQMNAWTGVGSGSFSGTNASASVTMNEPITQTASFSSLPVQSMSFAQQPGNVNQGVTITPEVQVVAIGTNGSPVAGAAVILSLGSGTGTLSGTLTRVTDGSGIAHFNDLSVNQPGSKTLTATAGGGPASPTNSNSFLVLGQVVALAFSTQPGSAVPGQPFGQQPVLKTVDVFDNPSTLGLPASLIVTVSLTNGIGTLSGTTSLDIGTSAGNGVVTFSNLAIDTASTSNQLVASTVPVATANPVAGAKLWLDASDSSTVTTNGIRVQGWKNKVNNISLTQNTSGLQPTRTSQIGGKPVLTFSKNGSGYGVGCTYLGNIGGNAYTNSGNQMTYFLVARQTSNSIGWQGPVSFTTSGQTDGNGNAGVVVLTDGSQGGFPMGIQRKHPGTPMQATVAIAPLNTAFVLTFVDNAGSASTSLTEFSGVSRSNTANIVNSISPYQYGITDVTVGGRLEPSPTVDNGWDGDVAEVVVYNTALSTTDRRSVEAYLTNKWFVSGAALSVSNAVSTPFDVQGAAISITVQPNPAGLSFTVDGVPYTTAQVFNWTPASSHTIAATSPQSGYVWTSWSDDGAISHSVAPTADTTYTANFAVLPEILGMMISSDGSVTISYSTVSGLSYHVETTTNLSPAVWTTTAGSTTNATGSIIIFIDPNAVGDPQRFYRVGSP